MPTVNDVPSAYQQFLEHTTAMLQPMHANLNRGTLPPPPPGLLWPTGPALSTALPQPLEEVNGERTNTIILYLIVHEPETHTVAKIINLHRVYFRKRG